MMKIPVRILLEKVLLDYSPVTAQAHLLKVLDVSCVTLFKGKFESEHLYILSASDLPQQQIQAQLPIGVICVEDSAIPESYIENENMILIRLPASACLREVYDAAMACWEEMSMQQQAMGTLRTLTSAAVKGDLVLLAEGIQQMLGMSVVILGRDAKVLASSEAAAGWPKEWKQLGQKGEYPGYNILQKLHNEDIFYQGERQICVVSEGSFVEQELFVPVFCAAGGKAAAAYLLVYCGGAYIYSDRMTVLALARDMISGMLSRFPVVNTANSILVSSMLEGILTGAIAGNDAINTYLKRYGFRKRKFYALIVVGPQELGFDKQDIDVFCSGNSYANIWESCYTSCIDGKAVILVSGNDMSLLAPDRLARFSKCLEAFDYVAGISDIFSQLNIYLCNHNARAGAAMEMSRVFFRADKRYRHYKEIAMYYLIKHGLSSDSHHLVDPRRLLLKEYDLKNGTDFLDTLRCFWLCDKSTEKSREMMHIHRNTLFYRLKKIRELSLLDLSSSSVFLDLSLSFAIAVRQGILQHIDAPPENAECGDTQEFGSL